MNQVILGLQQQLVNMKAQFPTAAASEEQFRKYFDERDAILDGILKAALEQETATTTELEDMRDAIKDFRTMMKNQASTVTQLSMRDIQFNLGKALVAAWNKDHKTLGELKFCPNLRNEKWNNPKDFVWQADKGFVASKAALGEPVGNLATNDQYLINPMYETVILEEAAKQSVMMPLVTHRLMSGASLFLNERDRGGVELKWLTSYGQKIDATKGNVPSRVELKAYTLAGYVSWYDEFEEDAYIDIGKMFMEDMMESYATEFDRQCLVAKADPFTGAMNADKAKVVPIKSTDESKLTYLDFRTAELAIPAEERKYCSWFMNETVLNYVANIQDANGNPIWRKPGDAMPGRIDGYEVYESTLLPQLTELGADKPIAIFMNPKKIVHGNRKGIEIKRYDDTTENLEYGESFMRFRKRDGFLVTRAAANIVILKTAKTSS